MSQEQFRDLFQAEFNALVDRGVPKTEAAATAIRNVKGRLSGSSGSLAFPSPASESGGVKSPTAGQNLSSSSSGATEPQGDLSVEEGHGSKCDLGEKPERVCEPVERISADSVRLLLDEASVSEDYTQVIRYCGRVFASSEVLRTSFSCSPVEANETLEAEIDEIPVNIEEAAKVFQILHACDSEGVINSVINGLENLSFVLRDTSKPLNDPCDLVQFLVVLEHPQLLDPQLFTVLKNILKAVDSLPEQSQRLISEWIGRHAGATRFKRYIDVLQQFMTLKLLSAEVEDGKAAARLLSLVYVQYEAHYSNRSASGACEKEPTISYKDFYNDVLNEEFLRTRTGRKTEYHLWNLDLEKGALTLRHRHLEEEKRILALQHSRQQQYLEEQQKQQQMLEKQKKELRSLQAQLAQLESSSVRGDAGGGAEAGEATPAQLAELQALQERLRVLDGHLSRQRESLAASSTSTSSSTGAVSNAAVQADGDSMDCTSISESTVQEDRNVSPDGESAQESTCMEQDVSETAPSEKAVDDINSKCDSSTSPLTSSSSGSSSGSSSSGIKAIPAKRPEQPLPTASVVGDRNCLTLWEMLPYCRRESFLSYSFLLTPAMKAEMLEIKVANEVQEGFQNEVLDARRRGLTHIIPYFVLEVRRGFIVMDTLNRILAMTMMAEASSMSPTAKTRMFKKPLKIIFDNEDGIDAGGVRKEYYQLLTKQLLDPSYGMFTYQEESKFLWFNPHGFENDQEFELIGLMIGIAIYNSIILELKLPLVTYKKLRGRKVGIEDLKILQPSVGNSLEKLLEYDGDDFESVFFGMKFEITSSMYDCPVTIELKPGGSDIAVTHENKQEYVDLYVKYVLEDSIKTQFDAFAKGFRRVCNNGGMDLFNYEELELLICGNPVLNMSDLRRGANYEDGYTAESETILQFWEVVGEFTDEENKMLLKFISGSDRSPIEGLADMKFVVSKSGVAGEPETDARLPSAHTCFNHLLLPPYSSIEVMRRKLRYAISHSEGFGLR